MIQKTSVSCPRKRESRPGRAARALDSRFRGHERMLKNLILNHVTFKATTEFVPKTVINLMRCSSDVFNYRPLCSLQLARPWGEAGAGGRFDFVALL
jgi:hypothetical protein